MLLPGIGRSLVKRLADQGLSVVLVALPDSHLDATFEQLTAEYPSVQFRKVCPTMHVVLSVGPLGRRTSASSWSPLLCVEVLPTCPQQQHPMVSDP